MRLDVTHVALMKNGEKMFREKITNRCVMVFSGLCIYWLLLLKVIMKDRV